MHKSEMGAAFLPLHKPPLFSSDVPRYLLHMENQGLVWNSWPAKPPQPRAGRCFLWVPSSGGWLWGSLVGKPAAWGPQQRAGGGLLSWGKDHLLCLYVENVLYSHGSSILCPTQHLGVTLLPTSYWLLSPVCSLSETCLKFPTVLSASATSAP